VGIQANQLKFLRYCHSKQALGDVVTLGRQSLLIRKYRREFGTFCEPLLQSEFGAGLVHSYDYSAIEGATHLADFNLPLGEHRRYQTVIDFGTLEHVFHIAQALRNASALCAIGGQIIHSSPANNYCGHGLWQFSPELFMSLYSEKNGYLDTEIFLAEDDDTHWFKVKAPKDGARVEVMSAKPLQLLCRTVKVREMPIEVQQSDYLHYWNGSPKSGTDSRLRAFIRSRPALYQPAIRVLGIFRRIQHPFLIGLNRRNPNLQKVRVSSLLRHALSINSVRGGDAEVNSVVIPGDDR
jgi:hypothetical protein